tara:strand:- start:42409 stop:43467 length:1059 start_codon:yes stop_codon:yes gene_type:complete
MNKYFKIFCYSFGIIIGSYFLISGLIKAQSFFSPLITAVVLSLIILPLAKKVERKLSRSATALLAALFFFLISLGFAALISFQIKSFVDEWPNIKETMKPKVEKVKNWAVQTLPISEDDLKLNQEKQKTLTSQSSAGSKSGSLLAGISGFLGNYLLTFIYIFFLLNYRHMFKIFILRAFPEKNRRRVTTAIDKSAKVAPHYLQGKLILIALLSVLYAIGLGISGVSNFMLVSLLAAILSLLPYIGNLIAFFIAMSLGYLTSGETGVLIGIVLTFSVAQFVESYVLEPYVVGDRVDLHPFFVILAVIIGNMIWGIIGMLLAIPLAAIVTVILLHIPPLKDVGILLSKHQFEEK